MPLAACGFGFLEIGTVLPYLQAGNERPRIIRLPAEKRLYNRMGFNSKGSIPVLNNLIAAGNLPIPLGVSLGKMKDTSLDCAAEDYCLVLESLYKYGDYFVINISSPNTLDLRQLQRREYLEKFLKSIAGYRRNLAGQSPMKPMLVKFAPDLTLPELDEAIDVCLAHNMNGGIFINTDIVEHEGKKYGQSGPHLFAKAKEIIKYVSRRTEGKWPLMGCGGVSSPAGAFEMLENGATLVQVLTGMIYEGPLLPKVINRGLRKILRKEKLESVSQLAFSSFLGHVLTTSSS
jgi:dihydroorotate dehydrogenase